MVDHGVGVIMDTLKRNKMEEDTLVVYLSDHGLPYGQHGWWRGWDSHPPIAPSSHCDPTMKAFSHRRTAGSVAS
jgi:arylsulfatase A-like enzyme